MGGGQQGPMGGPGFSLQQGLQPQQPMGLQSMLGAQLMGGGMPAMQSPMPGMLPERQNSGLGRFSTGLSVPRMTAQPRAYTPQSTSGYRPALATQTAERGLLAVNKKSTPWYSEGGA